MRFHCSAGVIVCLVTMLAMALPAEPADAQATTAGAFNVKLLNNNQPDFSDAASFARSCSYGWKTDQEKAISMWKWTCLNRVQTDVTISEVYERGLRPNYFQSDYYYQSEFDFITYLNSAPTQFCGFICPAFGAAWNLATGQFHAVNNIVMHTTADIWFDGKPHMFDTSLNCYVLNDQGAVASATELRENFKTQGGKWWMSGNNPMRMADSFECPILYDGRSTKEMAGKYEAGYQVRGGGEAINQMTLTIRPYTSYKRYKNPPAPTDENYFLPSRGDGDKQTYEGQGGGKFPNSYWNNGVCATSGEWTIAPDFAKKDWTQCAMSVANTVAKGGVLHPAAAGQDASVVFNITPYNSIAHMQIAAKAIRGENDTLEALISYDAGKSWTVLEPSISGDFSKVYRKEVLAKKAYLLQFRMKAASDTKTVSLQSLKIRVVTQVNRLSFFQLDRGNNRVYVNLGEQLDRVELRPDFRPEHILAAMYQAENLKAGEGPMRANARLQDPDKPGYATYRIDAPGDIRRITLGGVFAGWNPNGPMSLHYSTDMGKTWTPFPDGEIPLSDPRIGEKSPKSPDDTGHAQYAQKLVTDAIEAAGVRTILVKVQWSPKGPQAYANGIWRVWMAADYKPAAFTPFEVTLSWQEFHRDGTKPVRTFQKTITKPEPWTVLDVNVAGYRPPLMQYVTLSAVGCNPDKVAEGYSDGRDVGAGDEPTRWVYAMGKRLSTGRPVTANTMPEEKDKALARMVDERVTQNFFKTGARWQKGQNPEIVIELDGEQEVAGVSVHQNIDAAPAKGATASAYADQIEISVSADKEKWVSAGTISKYDLFNWPGDYLPLNLEAMQFADSFLGGIINYNCPLVFDRPLKAKYVKFAVKNPAANWTPSEMRVWGEMKKTTWAHDNFEHDKMN
jgi:hypothetical protein